MEKKTRTINKKPNEIIVVQGNNRCASEKGYKEFQEYFKNVKFCCRGLEMSCETEEYTDWARFIEYHRVTRTFSIGRKVINCCPFCGKKFPKELGLEWIHLVEEQFGEQYLSDPYKEDLPEEFRTDEWWKKRGL